ncbi:MAG: hypothetical protein ACYTEQ_17670 [Planctomycetota bacterium]|jgi:hypothetical protein
MLKAAEERQCLTISCQANVGRKFMGWFGQEQEVRRPMTVTIVAALAVGMAAAAFAQENGRDAASEMARKLQDSLAYMYAIFTENDILFGTGDGATSYSFQIQPVKSFDFPDRGISFIARGVIPILALAPESQRAICGDPLPGGGSHACGLGDINTQFFFAPKTKSAWKWGVWPAISWRTRTDSRLGGAGWGTGPAGVLTASLCIRYVVSAGKT